jgi:hypothetical protein
MARTARAFAELGDRGARLPPEGAARLAGLSEEDRAAAERARALTDAGSGPRRLGDHDDGEDLPRPGVTASAGAQSGPA